MSGRIGSRSQRFNLQVRRLFSQALDIAIPPACAICRRPGELLCGRCRADISWIERPVCQSCGRPAVGTNMCQRCLRNPVELTIRGATHYTGAVRDLIHRTKYEGYFAVAEILADLMFQGWPVWRRPVDGVIAIPLHAARLRKRGFNQADLVARGFAKRAELELAGGRLVRVRDTSPQVGMATNERFSNMVGAFQASGEDLVGKRLLLIDDVSTTGSTLVAASRVLLAAGAHSVSAYCVALTFSDNSRYVSKE